MDVSKLTPAPWHARGGGICCGVYQGTTETCGVAIDLQDPTWADAEFIALARNAFDVQMRRGWDVCAHRDPPPSKGVLCWIVCDAEDNVIGATSYFDPFTALVEADKWYMANVEKAQNQQPA